MIIKPILTKHMDAVQKIFKNRHLTVGASEIGQCQRKIWYLKHDPHAISDQEESLGASHRGNMIEQHTVVPAMRRAFGPNILFSGKDQRTFVAGASSATPDGLLINLPKDFLAEFGIKDIGKAREVLLEFKSIDPRIQLRAPKPEHERQALQGMGVIRMATEHRPEYCLIVYVNASFMDDVSEFTVAYDHSRYLKQRERAELILKAPTARSMPPEGWIKGGRECDYCGFHKACVELRTNVPEATGKADPQFTSEIRELAIKEQHWKTMASSAEEEQRKIQLQIKDRLREKNVRRISEHDISVNWFPVKPRITFDAEALRKAAAEANFNLAPYERVGDASDRLTISVSKQVIQPTAKAKGVTRR